MRTDREPEANQFRKLLARAAIYPALLMVLAAAALFSQIELLRDLGQWVDHTDVVLARVNEAARVALDGENALRGYALSGDAAFLGPYQVARRELAPALEALERLVADNPAQVERVRRLRALGVAWSADAAAAVEGPGETDAAGAMLRARRVTVEAFREQTRALVRAEEQLRAERSARARRASAVVVGSTLAISLLVGVALAALARAQLRRVKESHREAARAADERGAALAESEERFRLFVEGVHDSAIYMLDPSGTVMSWNAGAERIKGYGPEEIVGKAFSVFYAPEDVEAGAPERDLREAAERGRVEGESWRLRKDGSRIWAHVTVRALRDAGGQLVGYAKLVRDTTERKRASMRRAAQYGVARVLADALGVEDALPKLLEAVAAALGYQLAVAWAPRGDVLRVREAWLRPSARGESFLAALRAATFRRGESAPGRVWATGLPIWIEDVRGELAAPRAAQAMEAGLLSSLAFAVTAGDEVTYVVQLFVGEPRPRDPDLLEVATTLGLQVGAFVARQRQAAEAREAERRRADELERRVAERTVELTAVNRELEAFSYSVSHDLRAPLRALDGFSQVLIEDYAEELDAEARDYLARIRAASQRMSQLIDDLIQLSRATRTELHRDDVDLSALVREVAGEVQEREPARRVELLVQDGVRVRGDARLLRVGLVNLIGNAFKFTRGQLSARVEFGVTSGRDGRIYHVRDNGAGFDMAYAEKLFKPFQRLHTAAEFEGTGIGLATLQRIVHRHGGRVWAEGAPRQGATFYFTLGEH